MRAVIGELPEGKPASTRRPTVGELARVEKFSATWWRPATPSGCGVAARRLPGVEAEVVVIAAGGDEEDVAGRPPARYVARLEDDVEAETPT